MNQFALINYTLEKNERIIRLVFQPGTPWQDALEALDEFKTEILILKEEAERAEAERLSKETSSEVSA
jgi:hypothetical protein